MTAPKISSEDLMRLLQKRTSAAESERLLATIESDPELRAEYHELCEVAGALDVLANEEHDSPGAADAILSQVVPEPRPAVHRSWYPFAAVVSVCSVAAVMVIVTSLGDRSSPGSRSGADGNYGGGWQGTTRYNDARIVNATSAVLSYIEGTFGGLIMGVAGLAALVSFAHWAGTKDRRSLWMAVVCVALAIASFLLRASLAVYFNDEQVLRH